MSIPSACKILYRRDTNKEYLTSFDLLLQLFLIIVSDWEVIQNLKKTTQGSTRARREVAW